jgi:branched-chain amino acid transport system substrate-binding protein
MKKLIAACAAAIALAAPALAQVKVGVIIGTTGPAAGLGIPYKNTFAILPKTLGGQPVDYIIRDDASDPTNAVKFARDLVVGDKVDLLIGAGTVSSSLAIADVAAQLKTPQIAMAPVGAEISKNPWMFASVQPAPLMMAAVAADMKAHGIKTAGFIGFSDSWGDTVLNGLKAHADANGVKILTDQRYGRLDTSVVGQVLKVLASNPDAVVLGGSGTPGVLPLMTLRERGYKGRIYQNHGMVNREFLRVGTKAWDGVVAPAGPVVVAEQLADGAPTKKTAMEFAKLYDQVFGPGTRNSTSAYSYDTYLIADRAVAEAMKKAKPGTPEFRQAVRDALESSKEVVGTHGVYNMTATNHVGVDQRAVVLLRAENGDWKLVK